MEGIPILLEAIKEKLKRENGLDYSVSNIVVSNGAKHSLFNLFQVLIDEGDEVIIPAPYWVSYPEVVKYCGGTPVFVYADINDRFKITPKSLEQAITKKTKLLILNTPSNPTGSMYSKKEIQELSEVLKGSDILVISDEMYEKLVYDEEFVSVASVNNDMFERTITVNGLSKSVAMTGWRFGYFATSSGYIAKAVKKLQSQSTSNICTITQVAALKGIDGSAEKDIENMKIKFEKRRDKAVELFNRIKGLKVLKPQGAFYLFVDIEEVEKDSMKFCKALLEEEGVAVVPGIGFGMDGYFRFSFATDLNSIIEGIERIERFIKRRYGI